MTTQTKQVWTPGPWTYGPDTMNTMRVFASGREIVRALSTHGDRKVPKIERAANARLISKAPEMAELLRELVRCVKDELAASGNDWQSHPTMRRHNDTATKAERLLADLEAK